MREKRHKGDFHEFILTALLGIGPLHFQELRGIFMQFTLHVLNEPAGLISKHLLQTASGPIAVI